MKARIHITLKPGVLDPQGRAIQHAHQKGIIHCDIKPHNMLVTKDMRLKVTDFGTAKILQKGATQTGAILGTPSYMSPEQVKGKPVDGRSDIFSLGVILYELITGEKPFPGQNVTTVIYKIVNEEPIPACELDESIHPGLNYVIGKALQKDPELRYQTCKELVSDLRNYKELGHGMMESATVVAPGRARPKAVEEEIARQKTARESATLISSKAPEVEAPAPPPTRSLPRPMTLPPLTGSALRKVSLPKGSPYGGLLTQAAILKITSNGVATSPVLRGAWVMDRLIGQPPSPPPPGVPAVEPDIRGAKSMRDLLALHTKSAACASCHAKFDPVGLALENFDVMGRWRTRYRGLETGERISGIDRSGHDFSYTIAGAVDSSGQLADGREFKDVHALKAIFKANPRQLARNLLHQFTVYATGTPVRFADRREIESILDACAKNDYRVGDLLRALVQSKIFLGQKGGQA